MEPSRQHPADRTDGFGQDAAGETLARLLNVPFTIADATTLTEAGYVGGMSKTSSRSCCRNVITMSKAPRPALSTLMRSTRFRAKRKPVDHPGCVGRGRQALLLKLIEGTVASVPPQGGQASAAGVPAGRHPQYFVHLWRRLRVWKIIQARSTSTGIGFSADIRSTESETRGPGAGRGRTGDLIRFGLIP